MYELNETGLLWFYTSSYQSLTSVHTNIKFVFFKSKPI